MSINLDFPQPDPAWPYYSVWQATTEINRKVQELVSVLSTAEESNKDTDAQITTLLIELDVLTEVTRNTFVLK